MKKITYVDALNAVLNSADLENEVREKLTSLRDQYIKRNAHSESHKLTKTQVANAALKNEIVAFLSEHADQVFRVNEIATQFSISVQKASALMSQLAETEYVNKTTEKRITTYQFAA